MAADWVARGIALAGAVIALASLTWNVISWRRQGAVVAVPEVRVIERPEYDQYSVVMTLNNNGRLGTTIEAVDIASRPEDLPSKPSGSNVKSRRGLKLPLPLPPLGEASLLVELTKDERDVLLANKRLYVRLRTGAGKILTLVANSETK